MKDPNQYILIPEASSELNVLCETNEQPLKLNSASLLFSNEDCIIQTPKSILKLRKSNLLNRLAPKNLCIRLFCVKTTVNIMHTVHYTAVATVPPLISNSVTPIDLSARLTDDKEVKIVPKRIKLRT